MGANVVWLGSNSPPRHRKEDAMDNSLSKGECAVQHFELRQNLQEHVRDGQILGLFILSEEAQRGRE
jgi:hypothetical protein